MTPEDAILRELALYEPIVLRVARREARPEIDVAVLAAEDLAQEARIMLWHELRAGLLPADADHRRNFLHRRLRDRLRNYVRSWMPPSSERDIERKREARRLTAYPELVLDDE